VPPLRGRQEACGCGSTTSARAATSRTGAANALSVRLELQADCFAGVWAANNRNLLDSGDFAEEVRAAQAIGDDTLQRQSQGRVAPDSFTHGSADKRIRWLTKGFESGNPNACPAPSMFESRSSTPRPRVGLPLRKREIRDSVGGRRYGAPQLITVQADEPGTFQNGSLYKPFPVGAGYSPYPAQGR
jgi:hypothetical protein